ncbi:undecaprenyldiphospho-muramoylpentapeptide beta-N-acetylglucosaminyltransferase [Sphingomonas sp. ID0503]|uniref:undecaprenyldiphospho-muramoylpentapeptide beta-N-acetylglucosaminyltransferase n=1 Tax=Sphingomonas sp. ID0503 TaxID=3399691 RepID=UPI003AFAE5AD
MSIARHYVLAAGGTGGHMVPAHALGRELVERGHRVALITDERGARIPGLFKTDVETHVMPAGRLAGGLLGWLKAGRSILAGRAMARRLYRRADPMAVVGFGGYPALPALMGALADGIPTVIHEQNAVLGRVNRYLAKKVDAIATAYPVIERLPEGVEGKIHLVGNPVREEVLALRGQPFPALSSSLNVLVTGGSQGATILSKVVPDGLAALPAELRSKLRIVQQCRPEDIEGVKARYAELGLAADLLTYIEDMPARLADAHLVVARAGASTIAELTVAGRPAILVPLPSAMDDHQTVNAREMAETGGARAIAQTAFTAEALAAAIVDMAQDLPQTAALAAATGRPDATRDLADLLESIGPSPIVTPLKVKEEPVVGLAAPAALAMEGRR